MKALSIHPYYAYAIVTGCKSIEVRSWKTNYRGDIVICSTAKRMKGTVPGHALGVVMLEDIVPFERKHLKDALMTRSEYEKGLYAWKLSNNRLIVPHPVKGRLSLWNYDGPIEYIPLTEADILQPGEEDDDTDEMPWWMEKYWAPIMV